MFEAHEGQVVNEFRRLDEFADIEGTVSPPVADRGRVVETVDDIDAVFGDVPDLADLAARPPAEPRLMTSRSLVASMLPRTISGPLPNPALSPIGSSSDLSASNRFSSKL